MKQEVKVAKLETHFSTNEIVVADLVVPYVLVSTLDSESNHLSSNVSGTLF